MRTMPFVLLQFAIGVVFALFGVLYLSLVGFLAYRFFWGGGGWSLLVVGIVMLIGLVSFAYIWRLIQRYFLYMVKAGHIAVIAHIVENDEVPDNQLSFGMKRVSEVFLSASGLWVVSEVVDGVLKQLTRATTRLQRMVPVGVPPNVRTLITLVEKSVVMAVKYLDNAILAYIFINDEQNAWRSARDGVVLYGKTWKMVLGSTVAIVFGMYILAFALMTMLAPVAVVLDFLPTSLELVSWLLVGGVVATVHTGIVKPWVKTVVITTFLVEQREHTPDSETIEWIEARSDRFSELMEKAENEEPLDEEHVDTGGSSETPEELEKAA